MPSLDLTIAHLALLVLSLVPGDVHLLARVGESVRAQLSKVWLVAAGEHLLDVGQVEEIEAMVDWHARLAPLLEAGGVGAEDELLFERERERVMTRLLSLSKSITTTTIDLPRVFCFQSEWAPLCK